MSDADHHPYSPSQLERIFACPASVKMSVGLESPSSADADEGKLLHLAVKEGHWMGLDNDQVALVEFCLNYVESQRGLDGKIEKEVALSLIGDDFSVLTAGTADVVIRYGETVQVIDWKFGRVKVENASRNIQLRAYGAAAMQMYGVKECTITVVQPRLGKDAVSQFTMYESDLAGIILEIATVRNIAESANPLINAGSHCQHCPAICYVRAQKLSMAIRQHSTDMQTGEVFAEWLGVAAQFDKAKASLRFRATEFIQSGGRIPGYEIGTVQGDRKLTEGKANELYGILSPIIGHDAFMSLIKMSVPKAEKAFVEAVYIKAKEAGEKVTKKAATARFAELTGEVIERTKDTQALVRVSEEE